MLSLSCKRTIWLRVPIVQADSTRGTMTAINAKFRCFLNIAPVISDPVLFASRPLYTLQQNMAILCVVEAQAIQSEGGCGDQIFACCGCRVIGHIDE